MKDYERITALLKEFNLTANKLSKLLGLSSPQIFYDIKRGKCGISKELSNKIQEKFSNINRAWLLYGEGDMLKEMINIEADNGSAATVVGDATVNNSNNKNNSVNAELLELLKKSSSQIDELLHQNAELIKLISKK